MALSWWLVRAWAEKVEMVVPLVTSVGDLKLLDQPS